MGNWYVGKNPVTKTDPNGMSQGDDEGNPRDRQETELFGDCMTLRNESRWLKSRLLKPNKAAERNQGNNIAPGENGEHDAPNGNSGVILVTNGTTFVWKKELNTTQVTTAGLAAMKHAIEQMVQTESWEDWLSTSNGSIDTVTMVYTNRTQDDAAWSGWDNGHRGNYYVGFNPAATYTDTSGR